MAALFVCLFIFAAAGAGKVQAAPDGADAALEARVHAVSNQLRCLVCQNQSIAESNAPLAVDLRGQVREQLLQGKSERDIAAYMVARYGDFVLYRPPLQRSTLLLWLGPALLLCAGLGWLVLRLRRRACAPPEPLDDAQRRLARQLLDGHHRNTSHPSP